MPGLPAGEQMSATDFDRARVQKKLRLAAELFRLVYETKRAQLRERFPDLDARELNHRAYALIERGCAR
jgi:hypothetical protein